jgi:hypothetical protein
MLEPIPGELPVSVFDQLAAFSQLANPTVTGSAVGDPDASQDAKESLHTTVCRQHQLYSHTTIQLYKDVGDTIEDC